MSDGNGHTHLSLTRPTRLEVVEAELDRLYEVCCLIGQAYDEGRLTPELIDLLNRTMSTITEPL